MDSFREDIRSSSLLQKQATDLDTLASQFDDVLRSLLDHHAPLKQRLVTVRPSGPWYTPEVTLEKTKRRWLERKWRSSRLQSDREKYVHYCSLVSNLINSLKSEYYTSVIEEHSGNQRVLFKTVNKLLQKPSVKCYPSCPDNSSLAIILRTFLLAKLIRYIAHLPEKQITMRPASVTPSECCVNLCNFAEVNEYEVSEYATKPSSKSCSLDPLPAPVLKGCLKELLPFITKIVNLSLSNGVMPDPLKTAELLLSRKKPDADYKQFSNFRPISNLTMISKLGSRESSSCTANRLCCIQSSR